MVRLLSRRAQIALELLVVFAVSLVIIGPLYLFTFSQSTDNIKVTKAQTALDEVGRSVDYVYSLNPGTVISVTVDLPEGIISHNLTNKTMMYKVATSIGTTDVFFTTRANLNGTLPTSEGRHDVIINNTGSGVTLG